MHDQPALSVAQLRALDRHAVDTLGLPGAVLMENAGRNAAEALMQTLRAQLFAGLRPPPPWRVVVLCGRGGNGGDGYVLARHLHAAGQRVEVLSAAPAATLAGDPGLFRGVCDRLGMTVIDLPAAADVEVVVRRLADADAVVDALLGAGAAGAPREPYASWIRAANTERQALKLALDLPSGLDADSGAVPGECFRADLTVTFAAPKLAFAIPASATFTGRVQVAGIGVDPSSIAATGAGPASSPPDASSIAPSARTDYGAHAAPVSPGTVTGSRSSLRPQEDSS